MMKNGSFKTMTVITITAMVISLIIITAACILPSIIISDLSKRITPLLSDAIRSVVSGNTPASLESISRIRAIIDENKNIVMMLFDHNGIKALSYAAVTAEELARINDDSQLLSVLTSITSELEFMQHSCEARLFNLL